jgi:hydrogenase maturation protein HypF
MTRGRKRVDIRGTVQGVGFRPFIYRLANELDLTGFVLNVSGGVIVEIEGDEPALARFLDRLRTEAPPLSQIEHVEIADDAARGDAGFTIHHSETHIDEFGMVPPDVATCDECWADFTDPSNRRYLYPFTNCTNCGPRYTIIQDVPYDRPNTTMSVFPMCADCQREYDDPSNRRFHAQPNACARCGPALSETFDEIRRRLRAGEILAIKGLGGFHLACDAENDETVRRLRERKRRSDKAFALMVRDLDAACQIAIVTGADARALTSARRPIVLLPRRAGTRLSVAVAPGNNTLGIMHPYTPLHYLLFGAARAADPEFRALVMTSGNFTEEPIVSRNQDAARLNPLADHLVLHSREIQTRVDDSVLRVFENRERLIRRSRGYAPQPVDLGRPVHELLAVGGELKNAFCLTKGSYAILSQHIGDLENLETLRFFEETLHHMRRFFRVEPRAVAYDLHPGYLSTRFALEMPELEKIGVQHHHAHIASCMAENHVREKVIGIALDGTGYGTDGKIWGGEFLVCDYAGFERHGHFKYVPLAGGDAAIRHPWRVALGYLHEAFGREIPELFPSIPESSLRLVTSAIEQRINTVDTSSCGRLFDAVSAIAGVRLDVNYEGQAAIELEMISGEGIEDAYPVEVDCTQIDTMQIDTIQIDTMQIDTMQIDTMQIDTRPIIRAVVADVLAGAGAPRIGAKFHNTIANGIVEMARRIRAKEKIHRVALSGGTFQNMRLLSRSVALLRAEGFEVLLHSAVPANDGGLALGQAAIANEQLR